MTAEFGSITIIPGHNQGRYPFCHSVYVHADKKILFDPASNRARLEALKANPGVDAVVLTHVHEDHMLYLDLFDDRELWLHPADAPSLGNLDQFLDAYGMDEFERNHWTRVMLEDFNYKPRTPDRLLKDGVRIDLGGLAMEVIHTPGHTPGHLSFFFPSSKVLILGDYDLTRFGPWYGDVNSDIAATIASNRRLRDIPAQTWITGHEDGLFTDPPFDAWDHYLEAIDQREQKLLDLLKTPQTMTDIIDARILYRKKREPKAFFDFGERMHMSKHLERLMKQGRVVRRRETYQAV